MGGERPSSKGMARVKILLESQIVQKEQHDSTAVGVGRVRSFYTPVKDLKFVSYGTGEANEVS